MQQMLRYFKRQADWLLVQKCCLTPFINHLVWHVVVYMPMVFEIFPRWALTLLTWLEHLSTYISKSKFHYQILLYRAMKWKSDELIGKKAITDGFRICCPSLRCLHTSRPGALRWDNKCQTLLSSCYITIV